MISAGVRVVFFCESPTGLCRHQFQSQHIVGKQEMGDGKCGTAQCLQQMMCKLSQMTLKVEEAQLGCSQRRVSASYVGASTCRKFECFKQAYALNTLAWSNKIGPRLYLLVSRSEVMIDRSHPPF